MSVASVSFRPDRPGVTSRARTAALVENAGVITHVQVAVDGLWEEARRVSRAEGPHAVGELTSVLRPQGELAIEVFAADANGCQTFVGMRLRDIDKGEATELLRALLEVVAAESVGLSDVTEWLGGRTGTALFVGEPTRIEIGVVDAWVSLGARGLSITVSTGERDLRAMLERAAEGLRAPAGRVIAVEFAFDARLTHWVGVEVAMSTARGVVVSESMAAVVDVLGTGG